MTADFNKRTTIGELNNLPNRYIHAMWKPAYEQYIYDKLHPKEAEKRKTNEALANALT